ncbi:MAG: 50S ribosomal protein L19 [Candidatus Margulisiibacteriota bacterium]|nr:MAG: 50S ribosomal protein L19 [Candidatus Margulisbacteria bacterium GWD2_39_127]OGI03054.1 MAG: 50S ribosomal protein L19 [Candidatus Margulisbacteria bacterium GWF2_38_17]OGI11617.1 MAG: 50S ribosomal protein L19 [Candidatus Margulisbacteria bacterium GWE2_39_32]PZM79925.1 MAG: 50S ribosomal protein L19 [Candidatus Margulisiibacteriota bacterium]HAR62843.1 50S ribosomal protein L19 [Candidatus Margulisiibacteriota bacterium]
MSNIIEKIESAQVRSDFPEFHVGDTIKVYAKIIEGKKERIQFFQGIVIKMQNGSVQKTFSVRKVVGDVGVEKTFPLNSPKITKIEIITAGKVRRARLFYLRDRIGTKATRIKKKETKKS